MSTITREVLETRRQQLQAGIARLEANLHANQGALSLVETLIEELDTPEAETADGNCAKQ